MSRFRSEKKFDDLSIVLFSVRFSDSKKNAISSRFHDDFEFLSVLSIRDGKLLSKSNYVRAYVVADVRLRVVNIIVMYRTYLQILLTDGRPD